MRLLLSLAVFGAWQKGVRTPQLPMEVTLESYGRYRIDEPDDLPEGVDEVDVEAPLPMVAERVIERPAGIEVVDDFFIDGRAYEEEGVDRPRRALTSDEVDELTEGARLLAAGLSFALGVPLAAHPQPFGVNGLVADDDEDRRLLGELGTELVRISHTFSSGVEVFDYCEVDAELVGELARRGAVGVYADAMRVGSAVACYRELWRTLEIAFQAHGSALTALLAEFPPALELGFDRKELDDFLVLRGQISHASSRLGARDVARFEREATRRLGRLWSLVDRVLLTKKDSSRDLEVDELRPLIAHVRRDGVAILDAEVEEPESWFELFGTLSDRFH
ncbi:MAG TPA: hypothetical protein VMF55_01205 [Solirubrobacterales bacterium]|nr:hypothetical protein [Solirubrobacterales bacterium]